MRRHLVAIAAALAVTALAATQLPRVGIDTRILDILPDLPAARDYRAYVETFGGVENIWVAIEAPHGDLEIAADAAHALAERLSASELVASARCGPTERDEAFWFDVVLPRAILLGAVQDAPDLPGRLDPAAIRQRVRGMPARLAGPLGDFESQVFAADPLGLATGLLPALGASVRARYDPGLDVFVSHSRSRVLVVVTPSAQELDSEAGERVVSTLEEAIAQVRVELGVDIAYEAIGGPIWAVHDASIIRADVIRTTVGSALLVFLVLLGYFGGVRVPLVLTLALAAAVLWVAGLVAVTRGYLSVFGISFGAILIGLGVDYGIHAASAFRDALAGGSRPAAAMELAIRSTGPAILTSAVTTAAAFLVLVLSPEAPIREMGGLIAAGVAAVLLASLLLGAPLLVVLFERSARARLPASFVRRGVGRLADGVVRAAAAHRGPVLVATALLSVAAIGGVGLLEFQADLRTLRPQGGALEATERMFVEEFGFDLDTLQLIVTAPDLGAALLRADQVARELARRLDGASVDSAALFVPVGALARARAARASAWIDPRLPALLRAELDAAGFDVAAFAAPLAVLDAVAEGDVPADPPRRAWPDWVARDLRVDSGQASVVLRLAPSAPPGAGWPPQAWIDAIRDVAPDARIASVPLVGRELQQAVGGEFARLFAWSGAIVALVVLVSFRGRPWPSLLALTPVAVGSLWLLGICGFCGIPIQPFSVMVAPVLLGIGIDDGLHALHGVRQAGGLVESVRHVGRAMVATTLTTAAGFGSLLLSRAPALQQAGFLVAAGTLLCLVVSLTLLPAVGAGVRRRAGARALPADAP